MPKFVPVVDNEKSLVEQREDTAFDKHRRFDNPHKVDRGWQQGNVGWGVLGAFGSNSKDDAAQVIKRAEGGNKMIKNEKGLWVKAKEMDEDISHSKPGRGRGGGVSVYDELASRNMGSSESRNEITERSHNNQFDDADYRGIKRGSKSGRNSRDRGSDWHKHEDRRRDDPRDRRDERRDDRRDERRDDRRDDRGRDKYDRHRDRSRSRSPDRGRDDRDRKDSRRSPDRRRRNSRSRSRSTDRRRNDRDNNRSDRRRDRRSRSRSRSRSKSISRNKSTSERPRDKENSDSKHTANTTKVSLKDTELTAEELALQAEMMRSITAVQVINRFHEVFAHDTLFPSERLSAIGQVFLPGAVIASLKSGVEHISGQAAVQESFAKTTPTQPSISKRMYIEYTGEEAAMDSIMSSEDHATTATASGLEAGEETSSTAPKVTFCLDFHRPNTAPGLGDRSKHTVLLYRCANAVITHIWGMVDHEQLSQPEELEKGSILKSKVWAFVKPIVKKDLLTFDESRDAHFHNYDRMEVWGMF